VSVYKVGNIILLCNCRWNVSWGIWRSYIWTRCEEIKP